VAYSSALCRSEHLDRDEPIEPGRVYELRIELLPMSVLVRRARFARDSPQEEGGFEPSVPLSQIKPPATGCPTK
jgi:hypothetical protein